MLFVMAGCSNNQPSASSAQSSSASVQEESNEKNEDIKNVEQGIAELGDITLDSENKLNEVWNAFTSLSEEDQKMVSNAEDLTSAVKTFDKMFIQAALYVVTNKLDFISQYAGNVNGSGERKFADDFLNDIRDAFSKISYSKLVSEGMPEAYEVIEGFNEKAKDIIYLIEDMGETNSDENVQDIKSGAKDLMSEINAFMNNIDNY